MGISRKIIGSLALGWLAVTGPVSATAASEAHTGIRFGFVSGQNTLLRDDRGAELLASYLQRQLQAPVQPVSFPNTADLVRTLATRELDFAIIPNASWHDARETLTVVANFTSSAEPTHHLLLLTAKRRGFESVADLIATTPDLVLDQEVPSRHYFLVEQTGLATEDAFRSIQVPRRTVQGISGLISGTYGAACVESSVLETVQKFDQGMAGQLQILASAGPYASDPIVTSRTESEFLAQKLADTLLTMHKASLGQQVLLGLKIARFVEPITDPLRYPRAVEPRPPEPPAETPPPPPPPPPAPVVTPEPEVLQPAPEAPPALAEAALEAAAEQRKEAYAKVLSQDTVEAYGAFLALYPDAPEAAEVLRRKTQLETEDRLYLAAKDSEGQLAAFLSLFPDGHHVDDATARIAELRAARMETDYWKAAAENTTKALRAFLAKWPTSEHAAEARASLEALEAAAHVVEEPPPKPEPTPRWVLHAPFVSNGPVIGGMGTEAAWRQAKSQEIPLDGRTGPKTLTATALHDGASVFLLVRWPDPTEDAHLDPWLWDAAASKYVREQRPSDGLGVFWYHDPAPPTSCMISGDNMDADTWMWRPQWSALSGHADDWTVRASSTRLPKSNPYTALNGRGQVWVRRAPDNGEPGWRFVVPLENNGDQVPSYAAQPCSESRCDVRAAARWESGWWTVVLARSLDTDHGDDTPLVPGTTATASFAVYDHSGQEDHTASPLVEVKLAPLR